MIFRKPRKTQETYTETEISLYLKDALLAAGKPATGELRVLKLSRVREITVVLADTLDSFCQAELLTRQETVYLLIAAALVLQQRLGAADDDGD